jgi:hypothetical protein
MKPSQIALALEACIEADVPALVKGPPGIGKTYLVRELAARLNRPFVHLFAATLDPVDLIGVPYVDRPMIDGIAGNPVTRWAAPGLLPQEPNHIILIDEIAAAEPALQKALFSLIQFGMAGDYRAPENTSFIGCGNNDTDRAGVTRMLTPLKSRLVHLDMEVDHGDWIKWALANDIPTEIIGFLNFKPGLLHHFDPNATTFPCPRTWEFAGRLVRKGMPSGVLELAILSGTVGQGAAIELTAFLKIYRELPNVDAILLSPGKAEVPKDPTVLYALSAALAHRATPANFESVVTYTDRLPKEFAVLATTMAIRRDNKIPMTRAFSQWAANNQDVLA